MGSIGISQQKSLSSPIRFDVKWKPNRGVVDGTDGSMTPHGSHDRHMKMTPKRPKNRADLVRADKLASKVRRAIKPYKNVRAAQEAGYIQFPPDAEDMKIVHYVKPWLSFLSNWRFDPEEPSSLVYERRADGSLRLRGAMLLAPADASLEELNERVPLSIARWHKHVNICLPEPVWDREQWERQRGSRPVFGPDSPIATKKACEAVGGKFEKNVFGWMVHANVFADHPRCRMG